MLLWLANLGFAGGSSVVAANLTHGVHSLIGNITTGVQSAITSTHGIASAIGNVTTGVTSTITSTHGVNSEI